MEQYVNYPISLEGLIRAYEGFPQFLFRSRPAGPSTAMAVTQEFHLRRTDDLTSAVDCELIVMPNIPTGLTFGIAAGQPSANGSWVNQLIANTNYGIQINSVSTSGMNLNGFIQVKYEIPSTTTPGPELTTLAAVKTFLKITDTTFDTYLQDLIYSVSERMLSWMDRTFESTVVTGEKPACAGLHEVSLRGYPVQSVEEVREYGSTLDTDGYELDAKAGVLGRVYGECEGHWPRARYAVEVDYTHGYVTVPRDIQDAATWQVAWTFGLSKQDAGRLGMAGTSRETGTSEYTTTRSDWVPGTLSTMHRYKRLPEAV